MVVDLAVVVVVVVACLWLLFVIGVATALGVHVVVAAAVLPSFLLPCFLASLLPFLPSFLPSSFLVSLLSSFLPSCVAFASRKKGIKVFFRET